MRKEPGVRVELIDGGRGELAVLVDGAEVARKGASLPSADEVLAAVRKAGPASAG